MIQSKTKHQQITFPPKKDHRAGLSLIIGPLFKQMRAIFFSIKLHKWFSDFDSERICGFLDDY